MSQIGDRVAVARALRHLADQLIEQASSDIEVVRTTLHRDRALEDFYITVRTPDGREVRLCFEQADTRPFSELVAELKKVGL